MAVKRGFCFWVFQVSSKMLVHICSSMFPFVGIIIVMFRFTVMGHSVAQLVEARCYKSEGRGFHFRCVFWDFSLT